jgi:hypothetical protein
LSPIQGDILKKGKIKENEEIPLVIVRQLR